MTRRLWDPASAGLHARLRWRPASAGLLLAAIAFGFWLRLGPLPPGLLEDLAQPSTVIVDRTGEALYEVRSDSGTRGTALSANALPPMLSAATLAAEDVRFYSHVGVDPVAIARALYRNVRARHIVQGGSTITQQVAKLLLARQEGGQRTRGWRAKVHEAIVALRLEHRLTKAEILAIYLNRAPYGNQIDGAARAAEAYFGRDVATLTAAEAAFLAALPQQPGRFNPWRTPGRAEPRQRRILGTMAARNWLSAADLASARAERVSLNRRTTTLLAPHFVERALADAGEPRPRRIETTLDAALQRHVAGIVAANREALTQHHAMNVAVAVLDNRSGEWLAWEGSGNYFDAAHGGAIDGVSAPRQPGSALKPFTYAAAFERGTTPAQVLADVPSQFPTAEPGVLYSPRNYDGQFRGPLLARTALAGSENVPAVALASDVGVSTIARLLRKAGLTTLDKTAAHYGLGITLGDVEVRLDELVAAYAAFARGGETIAPVSWRRADGRRPKPAAGARIVSAATAFWITDILTDPEARAYIFGRGGSLEFPFPVAVKTGTSQAYHDNWAIGYTREVTVGVWVGNFDRTPLRGSSGVTGAGPIFHDVMMAAVERARESVVSRPNAPILEPPAHFRRVEVCAVSGLTPTASCPTHVLEWLPAGAQTTVCDWHVSDGHETTVVWPEPFQRWAHASGPSGRRTLPLAAPSAAAAKQVAAAPESRDLAITEPLAGALYLSDPTLRAEFQTLALRARGADGALRWSVDGQVVGTAEEHETVRWSLVRGVHVITVADVRGRSASAEITVR